MPMTRDIWIPCLLISPNHFNRFFIPKVEDLFCSGDWIISVENLILNSRLINWKAYQNNNLEI
jgi:hypothetical protein